MMPHILSEMTIPVDRVLPPWVDPHSMIVNSIEGIGIMTAVEAEMTIPENVIIWHLYQTLRDQNRPFVEADPGKVIVEKSHGGRFLWDRN